MKKIYLLMMSVLITLPFTLSACSLDDDEEEKDWTEQKSPVGSDELQQFLAGILQIRAIRCRYRKISPSLPVPRPWYTRFTPVVHSFHARGTLVSRPWYTRSTLVVHPFHGRETVAMANVLWSHTVVSALRWVIPLQMLRNLFHCHKNNSICNKSDRFMPVSCLHLQHHPRTKTHEKQKTNQIIT
jgi:hypothetical protein